MGLGKKTTKTEKIILDRKDFVDDSLFDYIVEALKYGSDLHFKDVVVCVTNP